MEQTAAVLAVLVLVGCASPHSPQPCRARGAARIELGRDGQGRLVVRQTLRLETKGREGDAFGCVWFQQGLLAEALTYSDLTLRRPHRRIDLRHDTSYRPVTGTLRIEDSGANQVEELFRGRRPAELYLEYVARPDSVTGEAATYTISLDIPLKVVRWSGVTYREGPLFCNAAAFPVELALALPGAREADVVLRNSHERAPWQPLDLAPWHRRSARFDLALRDQRPLLFHVSLPRHLVPGARAPSRWTRLLAWLHGDPGRGALGTLPLLSLLFLLALRRALPRRRIPRTYLLLRVVIGNALLLAPLALRAAGLFELERGGRIELSIVGYAWLLDGLALLALLAALTDRRIVVLGGRLRRYPRSLLEPALLARIDELDRMALLHLVVLDGARGEGGDLDPATLRLPGDAPPGARRLLELARSPRPWKELNVPPVNRLLGRRRARVALARARAEMDAALDGLERALRDGGGVYRAHHGEQVAALGRTLERNALWLVASPALRAEVHGRLERLRALADLEVPLPHPGIFAREMS